MPNAGSALRSGRYCVGGGPESATSGSCDSPPRDPDGAPPGQMSRQPPDPVFTVSPTVATDRAWSMWNIPTYRPEMATLIW